MAKIAKRLTRHPIILLVLFGVFAILSIQPIRELRWELQLQDVLSYKNETGTPYHEIEKKFGGLGSLTLVLEGDSLVNSQTVQKFAEVFTNDSLVHFLDYETDIQFYKNHSLLFLENRDLDTIQAKLEALKRRTILEHNPFYVKVNENETLDEAEKTSLNFNDVEEKYLQILKRSHANEKGTIRVIDIYPQKSLSNLKASRELVAKCQRFFDAIPDVKVHYTGKVYDTILRGRLLLPEAKFAGIFTALFILILLTIHFYKQPQLILVSALPIALPIIYVLALASVFFERINLFTLLLALVLPGQACQIVIHVLNRYFNERKNQLGVQLSIESAVLGIGPSTAVSASIFAGLFLTLWILPVPGLRELGLLGAIGSALNWLIGILLTSVLLSVFQRKKSFNVNYIKFKKRFRIKLLSYKLNTILIVLVSTISACGFFYGGYHLKFFYDFNQMEIGHEKNRADSLILQTGFPLYDPVIVMLPSIEASDDLLKNFDELKAKNKIPTIEKIYTLAEFLPKKEGYKKQKIDEIEALITRDLLRNLDSLELQEISKITESIFRSDIEENEIPENMLKKFSDNAGNSGVFAFVFSNVNLDNGLECRHLLRDLKKFDGIENGTYKISGTPILRATFLDAVLANLDKALIVGHVFIWLFLLLYYNRFSRAIFTVLPSVFAMSWLVFIIHLLGIELSAYRSLAFTILFGISVDGSLRLWATFYEKTDDTALTILQKNFFSVALTQLASLIGTYGLLMSSHPGLKSMGQISLIGLLCIATSQFLIFPLIAGSLDNHRLKKARKNAK